MRETAKLAYEGKGEQMPGDWCRFCRAKPVCKACKDEALSLCREEFIDLDEGALSDEESVSSKVDMSEPVFKQPGLIPISELAQLLPTLNRISSWIESVFAFISSEAINHGVPIPGYKVVEGRSKRVFTDTKGVVDTALANGYTDLYKKQLITLTEFEKMMGKKKFAELLGKYVTKPPGKLSLVPESDPREAVVLNNSLEQEFAALPDEGE
ncbi:MAG: DUF2800 domain-containing protein [Clostridia bacterium]|nr:DUF2800 domain-containing protein [Clostridia bacterium]